METSNASDIAYERVVYNKRAGCIYYIECYSLDHVFKVYGEKTFPIFIAGSRHNFDLNVTVMILIVCES